MPVFHTRDGSLLHYYDIGRGPSCVMLHAFGMRASMWLPFVLPYSSKRRFVMLDFRGFGGSRGVPLRHDDVLQQNADDLHDFLAHVSLHRPKLVGFSLGAGTALAYQRRYGFDRFEAYLHLDHTPCIRNKPGWNWGLMGPDNAEAFERGRDLLRAFEGIERNRKLSSLPTSLQKRFWAWFGTFFQHCFGQPWWQAFAWVASYYGPTNALLLNGDDWPVYLDYVRVHREGLRLPGIAAERGCPHLGGNRSTFQDLPARRRSRHRGVRAERAHHRVRLRGPRAARRSAESSRVDAASVSRAQGLIRRRRCSAKRGGIRLMMKALSVMDSSWLLMERRKTPMHIAGLSLFRLPEGRDATFLRDLFDRHRNCGPMRGPFNQKLCMPRLGLPVLQDDPDMDIDYHVRHSALPANGSYRDLFILVSRLHNREVG